MKRWFSESVKMLKSMHERCTEVKAIAFWIWIVTMCVAFVVGGIGIAAIVNAIMVFKAELVVRSIVAMLIVIILLSVSTVAATIANGEFYE